MMRTKTNSPSKEKDFTIANKISVIVPFYGTFDSSRLKISVSSILAQQEVDFEVILLEQSSIPSFSSLEFDPKIKYIQMPIELVAQKYFCPGKIRNFAAKNSSGEFIYNTDSDILFQDPFFLKRSLDLIHTKTDFALYRPQIRRLPLENFDEFCDYFNQNGLELCLKWLDRTSPYIATTYKNPIRMRVFKKYESGREKIFLYTENDHKKYREDFSNRGKEPMFSTLDTHAGGIFMRKTQFALVGGYCKFYAGWGCHDSDLQWKLAGLFDLQQYPYSPGFEVLHLDHKKDYFTKDRWLENRKIQTRRRIQGVSCAIQEDLNADI